MDEETVQEQTDELEQKELEAQQALEEKKKAAHTKLASIINRNLGKDKFSVDPQSKKEPEKSKEKEEPEKSGEEITDKETDTSAGKEETASAEKEKPEPETPPISEALSTQLSQAFPDEKIESVDDLNKKVGQLISDSQNLQAEREANQKVYDLFTNSEDLVGLVRNMNSGHSFLEALALTVDIDQTLNDLKENSPEEYKKIVKAQAQRELELEQRQKKEQALKDEFAKNETDSQKAIEKFKADQQIEDKTFDGLIGTIDKHFGELASGKVTPELLSLIHKGMSYDAQVAAKEEEIAKAREEGKIEGRNEKIKADKTRKAGDTLPDLKKGGPKTTPEVKVSRGKRSIASIVRNSRSTFGAH